MKQWTIFATGATLAIAVPLGATEAPQAKPKPPRDWSETLREDARALHEAIATSHPGMINPDDPGFSANNDTQLAAALEHAETADSFADYFYAMQRYTAAFNDSHMGYGVFGSTPDLEVKWPGFIARDDGNRGLKVTRSEDWSGVPVGSSVTHCDGLSAYELGASRIGKRFGRWTLGSQRHRYGAFVFVDYGDPYVDPITTCEFETPEGSKTVPLDWRSGGDDFYRRMDLFNFGEPAKIGMQEMEDGSYWVTLPTFTGNPGDPRSAQLRALLDEMAEQADALRNAPAIVLDLRGNGGGSGNRAHEIANVIWGQQAYRRFPEPPMTVVYRASPQILASLEETYERRDKNGGLEDSIRAFYERMISQIGEAVAKGEDRLVFEPNLDAWPKPGDPVPEFTPPAAQVFFLTDAICMSACLDAVDLWGRFGGVHIGQETGADTVYLEVRSVVMPSRIGSTSMPMKYFKGRERGHNETVIPDHVYEGNLGDNDAVETWVTALIDKAQS